MRKLLSISLALLLLAVASADAQSDTFIEALKYYNSGAQKQAQVLFEKELSDNPNNDAACFYLALSLMSEKSAKSMTTAEQLFKRAAMIDPSNYWYKHNLALFYMSTERPELASAMLEELIKSFPKKSSLYFDTANAYLQQNDLERAMSAIDKVEAITGKNETLGLTKMDLIQKLNPKEPRKAYEFLEEYYKDCKTERMASILGDYYHAIYQDSTALNYFDQALTINENYAPAYYGRAHCWQDLRHYDLYFQDINKFLTDKTITVDVKADYLQKIADIPQMVRAFQSEIDTLMLNTYSVHPADSTLSYVLAIWYYHTNRQVEAVQTMKTCVNFNPDSYSVAFKYLLIQYYSKMWADLTQSATIVIQRFPDHDDPMIVRASAFFELEEYQSSLEDYRTVLERHPKDSATIVNTCIPMGDIHYKLNDAPAAFKCYQKVLKVAPDHCGALNNYAYFLCLEGKNLKKAREMSYKTIEKEPQNPTYLDTYAWILHRMGQDIDAKLFFKKAMLYGGKEEKAILEHYAEVLNALGENELAKIYFNQAKSAGR